ncbi:hypothetical protein [Actinokineospora globicatena]|uniref:Uncharacterized protein n=1 Tax=Actinokineospora globicatena TaxID=103729 RepID=A0A9W6VCW8_9PSEU|nr:hypothetical protein [Actinokineospora globicatena]GLW94413.1 hypothetical protein Aglo03_52290 [Actinokineospora globicatena]
MTTPDHSAPHVPTAVGPGFVLDATQVARLPGDAPVVPQSVEQPPIVVNAAAYPTAGGPRWSRRGVIATVSVLLCAALGGGLAWATSVADTPPAPKQFDLRGTFTLYDTDFDARDGGCVGNGGYDDIAAGTRVVVYDNAAKVLATSVLGKGHRGTGECEFAFTAKGVRVGVGSVQVEVSDRGKIKFSEQAARTGDVHLELGNN